MRLSPRFQFENHQSLRFIFLNNYVYHIAQETAGGKTLLFLLFFSSDFTEIFGLCLFHCEVLVALTQQLYTMSSHISRASTVATTVNSPVPFLYQTQTLNTRCPFRPIQTQLKARYSTSNDASTDQPVDLTHRKPGGSFLRKRASILPREGPRRKPGRRLPTMTGPEKKTFGNLLSHIQNIKQTQRKEENLEEPTTVKEAEGPEKRSEQSEEKPTEEEQNEMSQISDIFDAVLQDLRRKRPNLQNLHPGDERLPERYYQETRMVKADPDSDPAGRQQVEPHRMSLRTATKLVAKKESSKIEGAIREAIADGRGDVGVWDICKKRIFSMMQYLGEVEGLEKYLKPPSNLAALEQAHERPENPGDAITLLKETHAEEAGESQNADARSANDPQSEQEAEMVNEHELGLSDLQLGKVNREPENHQSEEDGEEGRSVAGELAIPPSVPPEAVVSVLYPRMLLVAFRLLRDNFPKSPLIGQFRSTIKSHGRVSSVVGASTGLYNDLIYFHWRGCSDLPGVVTLLQEMEVTGVEPNKRTKQLLDSIFFQRKTDEREYNRLRDQGVDVPKDPWWDMAPNIKAMAALSSKHSFVSKLMKDPGWKEREKAKRWNDLREERKHFRKSRPWDRRSKTARLR